MTQRIWTRKTSQVLTQPAITFRHGGAFSAAVRYGRFAFLGVALSVALSVTLTMAGCGGAGVASSSATAPAGLQTPAKAGKFNTYVGTSPYDASASGFSPVDSYSGNGLWTATFDHSTSTFNVLDVTTDANNTDSTGNTKNVAGSIATVGGFLTLTQTNDPYNDNDNNAPPPAGFAIEIPGRVAVLRQGDNTIPLTALVPNGCPSIKGNTTFNFVVLPTPASAIDTTLPWDQSNDTAYGSVAIATSGATWNLTSYVQSTLSGAPGPNNGATLPAGTCAPTAVGPTTWVPSDPTLPLPKTVAVGPSGFYFADLGETDTGGYPAEFGVIQPSASLNTANMLSHKYLGFIFEPGEDCGTNCSSVFPIPESQLAAFSASTPAEQVTQCPSPLSSCLIGGAFPVNAITNNDDPTQPVASNLTIDLGTESSTNYGVYPSVSITNSNSWTTYQAVAVVGNPEGKFAIFILGYDTDNSLPLGIYLFEQ
jgi:hypothetical protein